MKPLVECAPCIVKWIYERTAPSASEEQRYLLMRTILGVLSHEFNASGNVGLICKRTLDAVSEFVFASKAHYNGIKAKTNKAVEELLPASRGFIRKGNKPRERFERACYLASAGNVSPIGAPSGALKFPELNNIITGRDHLPVVIGDIYGAASDAAHVLFLSDNAGEIGFDSLLIGELKAMGLRVTLVVKEDPFFEDATKRDASHFGLDKLADRILTTRGVFLPGESTTTLEDAYRQSDLVIAKGVFNFEALHGEVSGKPIIYMLKMKCGPLSEKNDVDKGSFIVRLENA
ncbi:MAG: DUF89 family protein [Deltaproteobacteria bacterium]|nr:MAG: DUF89 family protein [Deltaproteobacteria bacterium]